MFILQRGRYSLLPSFYKEGKCGTKSFNSFACTIIASKIWRQNMNSANLASESMFFLPLHYVVSLFNRHLICGVNKSNLYPSSLSKISQERTMKSSKHSVSSTYQLGNHKRGPSTFFTVKPLIFICAFLLFNSSN